MTDEPDIVLAVENLVTTYQTERGVVRAVDDVSFEVPRGAKIALVGESGSGKTATALSIMRLVQSPPGRIESGAIRLHDLELLTLPERAMRRVRGRRIAMVFQEPTTSLNPVFTVGFQIIEALRAHQRMSRRNARKRAIEMLELVGIGAPSTRIDEYPHQLSGGMRQRVMIAIALSSDPEVLVADEPTTALDVTVQAQILDLLDRLRERTGTAILLITHDLGVVASFAEHVIVMYAGQVVEQAPVRDLFSAPAHPYTRALLESLPPPPSDVPERGAPMTRLRAIEGQVPDLLALPKGCRFQNRCKDATDRCLAEEPLLRAVGDEGLARCHYAGEAEASEDSPLVATPTDEGEA